MACYRGVVSCAICMNTADGDWGVLECGHTFHISCSEGWLKDHRRNQCPTCRKKLQGKKLQKVYVDRELDIAGSDVDNSEFTRMHQQLNEQLRSLSVQLLALQAERDELAGEVEKRTESAVRSKAELKKSAREFQERLEREKEERDAVMARHREERKQLGATVYAVSTEKSALEQEVQVLQSKCNRLEREMKRNKIASTPTMAAIEISQLLGDSQDCLAEVVEQRNRENLMLKHQIAVLEAEKAEAASQHENRLAAARRESEKEIEKRAQECQTKGLEINKLEYELSRLKKRGKQMKQEASEYETAKLPPRRWPQPVQQPPDSPQAQRRPQPVQQPLQQQRQQQQLNHPKTQQPAVQQQQQQQRLVASSLAPGSGHELFETNRGLGKTPSDARGLGKAPNKNPVPQSHPLDDDEDSLDLVIEQSEGAEEEVIAPSKASNPGDGSHSSQVGKENKGFKLQGSLLPSKLIVRESGTTFGGGAGGGVAGPSFLGKPPSDPGQLIRQGSDGRGGVARSLVPSNVVQTKRPFGSEPAGSAKKRAGALGDQCRINQFFARK